MNSKGNIYCSYCDTFTKKGKYYCPEHTEPFKYCPFCGKKLVFEKKYSAGFWGYVSTLQEYSDIWRKAIDLGQEYHENGLDLDEHLGEIKDKLKEYDA